MLSCYACAWKAPWSSQFLLNTTSRLPLAAPSSTCLLTRSHTTVRSIKKGHHRRELSKTLKLTSKPKRLALKLEVGKAGSTRTRMAIDDAFARASNRQRRMIDPAADNSGIDEAPFTDRIKLAQDVVAQLRSGDVTQALDLVRQIYKTPTGTLVDTTVSWNHIIEWLMRQHNPKQAWKIFNEVTQFPLLTTLLLPS